MTTAAAHPWYSWFPELEDQAEVDALFQRISGATVSDTAAVGADVPAAPTPRHNRVTRRLLAAWEGRRAPFLSFCLAVVAEDVARLEALLAVSPVPLAQPAAVCEGLVDSLVSDVRRSVLRSLVELLHENRRRGLLPGDSPEARYVSFERLLDEPAHAQAFCDRYPLAVQAARRSAAQLCANTADLLQQTAEHRDQLEVVLGVLPGAGISVIDTSLGDRHRGGRSVSVITFDDGTRVVHKPRPLALDAAFNALLQRLNATAPALELAVIRVVPGRGCGWVEYVEPGAAPTPEDVPDFYRAAGRLMGLLHFLRANDLHYENFLRLGRRPVLVDLETLLATVPSADRGRRDRRAAEELAATVYSLGMLPTLMENPNQGLPGIDVGALGYRADQVSPYKAMVAVRPYTDEMRLELRHLPNQATSSFPVATDVHEEVEALLAGFAELYEWVLAHRAVFRTWVAELFADVQIRFVAAHTQRYAQQLRMLTGPRLQQSRPAREALLHRMALGRHDVPAAVIRSEIDQLHAGDVPYFSLRSGSRHIYDEAGIVVADALATTPLDGVLDTVDRASTRHMARNDWVTRLSYVGRLSPLLDVTGFAVDRVGRPDRVRAEATGGVADLIDLIAGQVSAHSIRATGELPVTWIGARVSSTSHQYWSVDELGIDAYSGAPGIALFLARAGAARHREDWSQLSLGYFQPTIRAMAREAGALGALDIGVHTGWPGVVHAALETGALLGDAELRASAVKLWALVPAHLRPGGAADVLGGSAGLLGASLSLSAHATDAGERAVFDDVAEAAFQHLVSSPGLLTPVAGGGPGANPGHYSGFAHGAAGVYAYLCRYGAVAGFDRVDPVVERLLEMERALYDPCAGEWQMGGDTRNAAYGWCHGAPGILLGKAVAGHFDPRRRREFAADVASLETLTRERAFGHNPSLCHGDIGSLDVLLEAARLGHDEAGRAVAEANAATYVTEELPAHLSRRLGRFALNDALMVGRVGAAHLALRLTADAPSALWFE